MWRFTPEDERRYDTLRGLRPATLRLARRVCRWRDGADPRRAALGNQDATAIEQRLIRDFAAAARTDPPGGR